MIFDAWTLEIHETIADHPWNDHKRNVPACQDADVTPHVEGSICNTKPVPLRFMAQVKAFQLKRKTRFRRFKEEDGGKCHLRTLQRDRV